MFNTSSIIVGLEIGTSKVCAVVGELGADVELRDRGVEEIDGPALARLVCVGSGQVDVVVVASGGVEEAAAQLFRPEVTIRGEARPAVDRTYRLIRKSKETLWKS